MAILQSVTSEFRLIVAFDNVVSTLLLVWTGLNRNCVITLVWVVCTWRVRRENNNVNKNNWKIYSVQTLGVVSWPNVSTILKSGGLIIGSTMRAKPPPELRAELLMRIRAEAAPPRQMRIWVQRPQKLDSCGYLVHCV